MNCLLIFIGTLLITISSAFAQVTSQDLDIIKDVFQKEKRSIVKEYIDLPEAESKKFWVIYKDYEADSKILIDRRVSNIKRYNSMHESLTPEAIDAIVEEGFELDKLRLKIDKTYYKRISKEISPKTAIRFMQIEDFLTTSVLSELYKNIPFVSSN
ncbi:hypothetical protein R9C00_11505 [Flammeovirgaceae bacterium SG7u.111]|nr:hypothetical protein [Flammeovirgaceae bacterium SG7u.132]WPO38078.1 hypothetical protein R9C00_11505 [Flammeovirgaceae bacterium SG7u.111]